MTFPWHTEENLEDGPKPRFAIRSQGARADNCFDFALTAVHGTSIDYHSRMAAAWFSRMAAACGQTALQTRSQCPRQRTHLRCETQPGASAQPLSSMVQPHGGTLRANGPANALPVP